MTIEYSFLEKKKKKKLRKKLINNRNTGKILTGLDAIIRLFEEEERKDVDFRLFILYLMYFFFSFFAFLFSVSSGLVWL